MRKRTGGRDEEQRDNDPEDNAWGNDAPGDGRDGR